MHDSVLPTKDLLVCHPQWPGEEIESGELLQEENCAIAPSIQCSVLGSNRSQDKQSTVRNRSGQFQAAAFPFFALLRHRVIYMKLPFLKAPAPRLQAKLYSTPMVLFLTTLQIWTLVVALRSMMDADSMQSCQFLCCIPTFGRQAPQEGSNGLTKGVP